VGKIEKYIKERSLIIGLCVIVVMLKIGIKNKMSSFEEHCKECEDKLGKSYPEVHKFLDQFAKVYGWSHRRIFHHNYGVELVRYYFGELQAKAAELHIKADCGDEIPKVNYWLDSNFWLNI